MSWHIVPQDDAWVKKAKLNLTACYDNKPMERMPFEFAHYDISGEFKPKNDGGKPSSPLKSVEQARREFLDPALSLTGQLDKIAQRVRQGFWDDSVYALHPIGGSTGWLTEVFGGKTEWFANRPPYPHPAIFDPRAIDRLRPDFNGSELYQAAIQHMRFFRDAVGDRIPIGAPDLQSPLDVASMILDYTQLVYAMMDDPARVHALLRMVTEAMTRACREFRREMTDYPMSHFDWWLPRGIFMSDDLQAVLNPALYKEFGVPYNEIVAKEFGGLALHSCGKIIHNVDNVVSTKGLCALNTHERLADVAPIVKNRCAVILGGLFKVMAPNYPGADRANCTTADELEAMWFEDCSRLAEIKGQRMLYQCHALLASKHTAQEAYQLVSKLSRESARNMPSGK